LVAILWRWWILGRQNKRWTWSRTRGAIEWSGICSSSRRERNSLIWDWPCTGKFLL